LFIPETIGAIVYLFHYGENLKKTLHAGLVLTCLGDRGGFNYKRTRHGNHELDQIVSNVLFHSGKQFSIHDFWPLGSDERQYSSPGFNFPVGSLMRSIYNEFTEYHTSGDNLDLVTEKSLNESLEIYTNVIYCLEGNLTYQRNSPFCEPMLGKYNLYNDIGGTTKEVENDNKEEILWILNYSDSQHSLVEISDKMGAPLSNLIKTAKLLESNNLIYAV
jgi:aminopeptidase-like protein